MKKLGEPVFTDVQLFEMREAAKPLVKWLNDNANPHTKAIVETDGIEVVSGEARQIIRDYIRD